MKPSNRSFSVYDSTLRKRPLADDELRQLLEESDDDDFIALLEFDTEDLVETDCDIKHEIIGTNSVNDSDNNEDQQKDFYLVKSKIKWAATPYKRLGTLSILMQEKLGYQRTVPFGLPDFTTCTKKEATTAFLRLRDERLWANTGVNSRYT
ncbi:hypothetical protein ILUMI_09927 [Ignelater luminosus]|uniref:Uncharacterized protein n=1 Tax=Ignelater luminosus TaxID=2038154 RepID=A0A8K0G967_IGNLU|nr:hypothetical protein ILUMI_09927 [Ignelater luminosus]